MNQLKRRLIIALCVLVMPFTFGGNALVFADTPVLDISDIGVYIDGIEVDFPDAKPYISNSRTLVPVRFVAEQLGASIDWNGDTGTVVISKDNNSIELVIGSRELVSNGVTNTMDVAPVIADGRTMIPLRFVSEQLGVVVKWDVEKNSAMLIRIKLKLGNPIIPVDTKTPEVTRGAGRRILLEGSPAELIAYAKEYIGVSYAYNGTTPSGFDCSGFTQYIVAHFGGILPHSSGDQYYYGVRVERENLAPGDLVFFEKSDNPLKIGHVGIYIGEGQFIHSPQAGENIKITNLSNTYFGPRFYGAIRMVFSSL